MLTFPSLWEHTSRTKTSVQYYFDFSFKREISSPPRSCCFRPPFLNKLLNTFYLPILDVDLVSPFTAPGVCPVIRNIFVDGTEFPGHHGLVHEDVVPDHPVPFVIPQTDLINDVPGQGRLGHRRTKATAALPQLRVGVFLEEPKYLLCLDTKVERSFDRIPRDSHENHVGEPPNRLDLAEQAQHAHVQLRRRVGAQLEVGLDDDRQVARIVRLGLGEGRFEGLVGPAPHPAALAAATAPRVVPSGELHCNASGIKDGCPTDLLVVDKSEEAQIFDDFQPPFRQRGGRIALSEAGKTQAD
mmetsp:Transcript_15511/g.31826  ORF Transcript_15511/g.31826 Transcript_15511/m.31826 type:complete len:299 (+) Transcript_15511:1538-2434(+)